MDEKNKHLLTRAEDRISFLYIQYARIEQTEYAVQVIQGKTTAEIPITTVNCMLLGPGTSITHKAVANTTAAGWGVIWRHFMHMEFQVQIIPKIFLCKFVIMRTRKHIWMSYIKCIKLDIQKNA